MIDPCPQDTPFSNHPVINQLDALLRESDQVFVKRLALNDWQWATNPDAHQGGFYVPIQERDSGFFPPLEAAVGQKGARVNEVFFEITWPQAEWSKEARLVNYPSKGEETQLTRVPKIPFTDIPPTSTLVMGRTRKNDARFRYEAMIIHAETEAAAWLREFFDLPANYHSVVLDPAEAFRRKENLSVDFIALAYAAFAKGEFDDFAQRHGTIPDTAIMASLAQNEFLADKSFKTIDPFKLERPGDILLTLSQDIEWKLFKTREHQSRSIEIMREVFARKPSANSVESVFKNIILKFPEINRILLSAAQQRKSRAGYSLEHHLGRMLKDGGIPHVEQPILKGKRRPDFILPNTTLFLENRRNPEDALVLSAKSTLRERWKQVQGEAGGSDLYLATLDGSIAKNAIGQMGDQGIRLVVPESLKDSNETVYKACTEVISFTEFFQTEIRARRYPIWRRLGILKTERP